MALSDLVTQMKGGGISPKQPSTPSQIGGGLSGLVSQMKGETAPSARMIPDPVQKAVAQTYPEARPEPQEPKTLFKKYQDWSNQTGKSIADTFYSFAKEEKKYRETTSLLKQVTDPFGSIRRFQENLSAQALNTETAQAITKQVYDKTSKIGLKGYARLESIGAKTYDEAYAAAQARAVDPTNNQLERLMYGVADSGIQSVVIAGLSLAAGAVTRSPMVSRTVAGGLFGGVATEAERMEKGTITPTGTRNILIDTAGDMVLSNWAEMALKSFATKTAAKFLTKEGLKSFSQSFMKAFGIEGSTEVVQSFAKFGNEYASATTPQERADIVEKLKEYVRSGAMMDEFLIGGVSGGIVSGGVEIAGRVGLGKPDAMQQLGNQLKKNPKDEDVKKEIESSGLGENVRNSIETNGQEEVITELQSQLDVDLPTASKIVQIATTPALPSPEEVARELKATRDNVERSVALQKQSTEEIISRTEEILQAHKEDATFLEDELKDIEARIAELEKRTEPEAKLAVEAMRLLPAPKEAKLLSAPKDIERGDTVKIKTNATGVAREAEVVEVREEGIVATIKGDAHFPEVPMLYPAKQFTAVPHVPKVTDVSYAEWKKREEEKRARRALEQAAKAPEYREKAKKAEKMPVIAEVFERKADEIEGKEPKRKPKETSSTTKKERTDAIVKAEAWRRGDKYSVVYEFEGTTVQKRGFKTEDEAHAWIDANATRSDRMQKIHEMVSKEREAPQKQVEEVQKEKPVSIPKITGKEADHLFGKKPTLEVDEKVKKLEQDARNIIARNGYVITYDKNGRIEYTGAGKDTYVFDVSVIGALYQKSLEAKEYLSNIKVGDVIRFDRFGSMREEVVTRISKKRDGTMSSFGFKTAYGTDSVESKDVLYGKVSIEKTLNTYRFRSRGYDENSKYDVREIIDIIGEGILKPRIAEETVYRGTEDDGELRESMDTDYGPGYYFADKKSTAKGYGSKVVAYTVKLNNPLRIKNRYEMNGVFDDYIAKKNSGEVPDYGNIQEYLKVQGYDGIKVEDGGLAGQEGVGGFTIAFDKEQVTVTKEKSPFDVSDAINRARVSVESLEKPTGALTLESAHKIVDNIRTGKTTAEELKANFEQFIAQKSTLTEEISKMSKEEIMKKYRLGYRSRPSDKKASLVNSAYQSMIDAFHPNKNFSWSPFSETQEQAAARIVATVTDEDIQAAAKEREEYIAKRKVEAEKVAEGMKNPQTLEDFRRLADANGLDSLTTEQRIKYDELQAEKVKADTEERTKQKALVRGVNAGVSFELQQTKHTKTGADLYVVTMSSRVETETYRQLVSAAKRLGGYYSSFKGAGAIPGFQFKSPEDAQTFMQAGQGETVDTSEKMDERKEEQKSRTTNKLANLAEVIEERATEKLNQNRQTNTARRAAMASGAEADARRDIQLARTMKNLASAIESGQAKFLDGISAKSHIEQIEQLLRRAQYKELSAKYPDYGERLKHEGEPITDETVLKVDATDLIPRFRGDHLHKEVLEPMSKKSGWKRISTSFAKKVPNNDEIWSPKTGTETDELAQMIKEAGLPSHSTILNSADNYRRWRAMGVVNLPQMRAMVREYVTFRGDAVQEDKVKQLERDLIGRKVGFDFFPTPRAVAEQMVMEAGIKSGMKVLEPSAGNGNIAESIRDAGVSPDTIELSGDLRAILEAKGFNVVGNDFLEHTDGGYDAIVMNPPFGTNDDIKHVQHAYDLLADGGKLVSIVGEGAFSRSGKTESAFRDWLDLMGASVEQLPEGTFQDKTLMQTTGARGRMVVIDKPLVHFARKEEVDDELRDAVIEGINALTTKDLMDAKDNIDFDLTKEVEYLREGFELGKDTMADVHRGAEILAVRGGLREFRQVDFARKEELTTKILEKLGDRETVSKQFIIDATKQQGISGSERELIVGIVAEEGDKVNVKEFSDKVRTALLPLRINLRSKDRWPGSNWKGFEHVNLPEEQRGPVENYFERIYESPIKTSADEVHYPGDTENYFAHTRVEDLGIVNRKKLGARDELISYIEMRESQGATKEVIKNELRSARESESTRRVIEIQSDLMQKGRLESEKGHWELLQEDENLLGMEKRLGKEASDKLRQERKNLIESKLEPYRNTWQDRIIREEVRQAALDGKTKLQFPTGETAMKIEGLGQDEGWSLWNEELKTSLTLNSDMLNEKMIGETVIATRQASDKWIIIDVLGDGKFRATPKKDYDLFIKMSSPDNFKIVEIGGRYIVDVKKGVNVPFGTREEAEAYIKRKTELSPSNLASVETFDISGKVDTENPIYKFYEKEVAKYLRNKYGAQLIIDAQGVTWNEVTITPDMAGPVLAFRTSGDFHDAEHGPLATPEYVRYIVAQFAARLGLDINLSFVDNIYTGEKSRAVFAMNGEKIDIEAWAATLGREMVFDKNGVPKYTPAHEVLHFVINNLDKMEADFGMSRMELLTAQNGGKMPLTQKQEQKLGEDLAHGFESAWQASQEGRAHGVKGIVGRFFDRLIAYVKQMIGIPRSNEEMIRNFYDKALYMRRRGATITDTPYNLERFETAPGILNFGVQGAYMQKVDPLTTEARKYKTAEDGYVYRGVKTDAIDGKNGRGGDWGNGTYFATDQKTARVYGKNMQRAYPLEEPYVFSYKSYDDLQNSIKQLDNKAKELGITFGNRDLLGDKLTAVAKKLGHDGIKIDGQGIEVHFNNKPYKGLIDNSPSSKNRVSIVHEKNQVAGWQSRTEQDAIESAKLYLEQNPQHKFATVNGQKYDLSQLTDIWNESQETPSFMRKDYTLEEYDALSEEEQRQVDAEVMMEDVMSGYDAPLIEQVVDDLLSGKRHIAVSKDGTNMSEDKEMLGKALYMRIFRKQKHGKYVMAMDELLQELRENGYPDITEYELRERILARSEARKLAVEEHKIIRERAREARKNEIAKAKTEADELKVLRAIERDLTRQLLAKRYTIKQYVGALEKGEKKGYKEGVRSQKNRAKRISGVKEALNLTDAEVRRILGRRDFRLMTDRDFDALIEEMEMRGELVAEHSEALAQLQGTIYDLELVHVENLQTVLGYPKQFSEMTTQQLREFEAILSKYQVGDVFLGKRTLETIDRTDLTGIRTYREAKARLAKETGVPFSELEKIKVGELDRFRWDAILRERNVFYRLMIDTLNHAFLGADSHTITIEKQINALLKAARRSRMKEMSLTQKVIHAVIPTDEYVFKWNDSSIEVKQELAKEMTREEMTAALFVQKYFAEARDHLVAQEMMKDYRENYITHIRRGFLEAWKDGGVKVAISELLKAQEQDQAAFTILDKKTGAILPIEKYFGYAMHRTGGVVPTKNVASAFLGYAKQFERKKAYDTVLPKIHAYTSALTPLEVTEGGVIVDDSLRTFVNTWVNSKKGRRAEPVWNPGGKIDWVVRALDVFLTIKFLGFNVASGLTSQIGEFMGTYYTLGEKKTALGVGRLATPRGQKFVAKYEEFVGRTPWDTLQEMTKGMPEKLFEFGLFGLFKSGTVRANKIHLLGSLTKEEWESGEVSTDRLTEMKVELGRWRVVEGAESVLGKTTAGGVVKRFKTWAFVMANRAVKDIAHVTKMLAKGDAKQVMKTREFHEMLRVAVTGALLALIIASMFDEDETKYNKDETFWQEMRRKAIRDAYSVFQAMSPSTLMSAPIMVDWLVQLGKALQSLVALEEYKTSKKGEYHKGDLKAIPALERLFTPTILK